eukprot:tig00021312_g20092.t1
MTLVDSIEDIDAFLEEESALYAAFSKNWVGERKLHPERPLGQRHADLAKAGHRPSAPEKRDRDRRHHHDSSHAPRSRDRPAARPGLPAPPNGAPGRDDRPGDFASGGHGSAVPRPPESAPVAGPSSAAESSSKVKRSSSKRPAGEVPIGIDSVHTQLKALLDNLKGKMTSGELEADAPRGRHPAPRSSSRTAGAPAPPAPQPPRSPPPPRRSRSHRDVPWAGESGQSAGEEPRHRPDDASGPEAAPGASSSGAEAAADAQIDETGVTKHRRKLRQKRQAARIKAVEEAHRSVYRGKDWKDEGLDAKALAAGPPSAGAGDEADRGRRMQEWNERIGRQLALEKLRRQEAAAEDQRRAQQKNERREESAKRFAEWKAKKDAEKAAAEAARAKEREEARAKAAAEGKPAEAGGAEGSEAAPFAGVPEGPEGILLAAVAAAADAVRKREERERPWRASRAGSGSKRAGGSRRSLGDAGPAEAPAAAAEAAADGVSLRAVEGEVSKAIAAAAAAAAAEAEVAAARASRRERSEPKPAPSFEEWKKEKRRRDKEAERRRQEALKRFGIGPYARPREAEPEHGAGPGAAAAAAVLEAAAAADEAEAEAGQRRPERYRGVPAAGEEGMGGAVDRLAVRAWRESLEAAVAGNREREQETALRRSCGGWEGSVAGDRARADRRQGLDRPFVATSRAYVRMHGQARFPVRDGESLAAREALEAEQRVRAEARRRRQRETERRRAQEKAEHFELHLAAKQAGSATMQAFMRGREKDVTSAAAVAHERRVEENLYLLQDVEARVDRAVARASVAGPGGEASRPAPRRAPGAGAEGGGGGGRWRCRRGDPGPAVALAVAAAAGAAGVAGAGPAGVGPHGGAGAGPRAPPPPVVVDGLGLAGGPAPSAAPQLDRERERRALASPPPPPPPPPRAPRAPGVGPAATFAAAVGAAAADGRAAGPLPAAVREAARGHDQPAPWADEDVYEDFGDDDFDEAPARAAGQRRERPRSAKPNGAHPGRPWSAGWRSATAERAELGIDAEPATTAAAARPTAPPLAVPPPPPPAPAVAGAGAAPLSGRSVEDTLDELIARREAIKRRLLAAGL